MKKRILSFALACLLLFSLAPAVFTAGESRVVLGADLSEQQIQTVYALFGIERGSVEELTITNAEERAYLEGLIDESVIGTKSFSSVYVQMLDEGAGIGVETYNIDWCTPEMYQNALVTAGVSDARIVVAAPFASSGTAALAGIFKAYENLTGRTLDEKAKSAGTQELSITGELSEQIGKLNAIKIIARLKGLLSESAELDDEALRREIVSIAGEYDVTLSERQIDQLAELFRSLEKLNVDTIRERVENAQETIQQIQEAKDKAQGFYEKLGGFFSFVRDFFAGLKELFG